MSLQQNNINKYPKHLQHVRLQKEEEEEQWISGEELCTEGSSDEENTNDVKKKFKSKPLHLPSKDSFKMNLSTATNSTTSLSSVSTKESDEDITDSTASSQNSPTQWRPKRGSIKLPNIDEKPLDIETEIWNTEFEYLEAVKQLKTIKNELNATTEHVNDTDDIKLDNNDTLSMENDIKILTKVLQECKRERINYQNVICEKLKSFNSTSLELHNTKKFLAIFNNNPDSNINKTPPNTNNLGYKIKPFSRKKCKYPVHKNKRMTDAVLNDYQKARLKYLLSDIDIAVTDDNEKDTDTKEINYDEVCENSENAFKITGDDLIKIENIEKEIKTLQEMCDDADLKGKLSEDFYSIDEESREWKAYLKVVEEKCRRIDTKINKLREDDPTEKQET